MHILKRRRLDRPRPVTVMLIGLLLVLAGCQSGSAQVATSTPGASVTASSTTTASISATPISSIPISSISASTVSASTTSASTTSAATASAATASAGTVSAAPTPSSALPAPAPPSESDPPLSTRMPAVQTAATQVRGVPAVGPLFPGGLNEDHNCTASVIDSPGHDLLLAAAHCLAGTGAGVLFAPGYDSGHAPFGTFAVQRVWADPAWINGYDDRYDYAIVQVADNRSEGRKVQDVTGGYRLGSTPAAGTAIQVTGYLTGLDDAPLGCSTVVAVSDGFPGFACDRFAGGTSGSPLVTATTTGPAVLGTVVGLIGGLHEGGCSTDVSYSPPLGADVMQLLARAIAGGTGDALPGSGPNDC